ncbi:MAG TPA: ADOP family duplicated permease [Bryobacteraceae bacterium]|nr:ADOP family duplicated permease [Bryobacteraceae bacterium]
MRFAESLWQDARTALRVLSKSPSTTALCVLSLALGIGLTTGIFSVGDAMLLRPFAFPRPSEVFQVWSTGDDGRVFLYGWPDYEDMAHNANSIAEIAAYERRGAMLTQGDERSLLLAYAASPNFFPLLGVKPLLGRASFDPVSGRPAAVLGYRVWQRQFAGDPAIVGKTILLRGEAFTVAGVLPPEFTGLGRGIVNDVWVSAGAWFDVMGNRDERQSRDGQFEMIARLKPGITAERAAAQFDAAIRGAAKHKPAPKNAAGTFLEAAFAPGWRATLFGGGGLLLMLGLVLFVACANVAQLRLAQAESRKKELSIRLALGGGSWRIMRQLLVETALVSFAGAALGILLAQTLMEKTSEFIAARYAYADLGLRLDSRVLGFALAAAIAAVFVAGLAPSRHSVRLNLAEILKSEQGATGARSTWQKRFLIIGQVAVSVALFGMAVLFFESLRNAAAIHPGIDPQKKLLVLGVSPGREISHILWCEEISGRLSALPGVRAATFARRIPLADSGGGMTARVEIPGQAPLGVHLNNVAGNYFSVMGTRVLAGRAIDANDRATSHLAVVVSQHFARQVFGTRNPLGQWISVEGKMREIVGISEDGPSNYLHEDPQPFLYLPFAQAPSGDITLMVETAGDPASLTHAVRSELKRFDPGAIVFSTTTLRRHMQQALTMDQLMAAFSTGLGAFGFLLTAAGLFGVIQYAVNRRTREIGLRMSLGAQFAAIQKMVLAESLRLTVWGIPAGLLLLAAAQWSVRSFVLGVTPLDPVTYLTSTAAAVIVALFAAWLPARRATQVDPMAALRSE